MFGRPDFYLYAAGVSGTIPFLSPFFAQVSGVPVDLMQLIDRGGTVGVLAIGIWLLLKERRAITQDLATKVAEVDAKVEAYHVETEMQFDRFESILNKQLTALDKIEKGQSECFNRLWDTVARLPAVRKGVLVDKISTAEQP